MKITALIWEHFEGSDDPRAIQGGGGTGSRCIGRHTNSPWLIRAYVAALASKYDDQYSFTTVIAGRD